jgi:hypothetical protein
VDLTSARRGGESVPFPVRPIELAWSPDGRRFAVSHNDGISLVGRDGSLLFANPLLSIRPTPRWSIDGRSILVFRWTAGQNDDLTAFPVDNDGRFGAPQLLVSQVPTLLSGDFDVARTTGRIVVASGAEFSDVWSFDLSASAVRASRLTQGTSWHGPPTLTADGRALYYLRTDPLGNSLYSIVDGREAALTAEPQIVNRSLRLARDERVIVFESSVNDAPVLMVYDIASGSVRQIPRGPSDLGWPLPDGKRIVWMRGADKQAENGLLWLTDAAGGNRREITDATAGATAMSGAYWALAPDGATVALLAPTTDAWVISLVPLDAGARTTLARFPFDEGDLGLVGWSRDGTISVARRLMASPGTTSVIGIDARTGAVRPLFVLPIACDPADISYAPLGRRAACLVPERRADLMLIDGVQP